LREYGRVRRDGIGSSKNINGNKILGRTAVLYKCRWMDLIARPELNAAR
jgi:hypothetical protein